MTNAPCLAGPVGIRGSDPGPMSIALPPHLRADCGVQYLLSTPDTVRVSWLAMDLRLLRYFVTVAEERHFGRAAARLHMTQPPLSRAIRQLETDLGAILLHRSAAGGATLYDEARALLEHADHARTLVAAAAGTATFTIGVLADSAEEPGISLG